MNSYLVIFLLKLIDSLFFVLARNDDDEMYQLNYDTRKST